MPWLAAGFLWPLALPDFAPALERMIQNSLQMMPQIAERFRISPC